MSTAPRIDIDVAAFWHDPYPTLARLRRDAPIAFVPQLGSTLLCSRDDIFVCEKQIDVFSSHQPEGLMNKLMGHNMMRKDGQAHLAERQAIFPTISPKTVKTHWTGQFQAHADRIIDALEPTGACDFVRDFAWLAVVGIDGEPGALLVKRCPRREDFPYPHHRLFIIQCAVSVNERAGAGLQTNARGQGFRSRAEIHDGHARLGQQTAIGFLGHHAAAGRDDAAVLESLEQHLCLEGAELRLAFFLEDLRDALAGPPLQK